MTHSVTAAVVETPRLRTNAWTSGPEDGTPLLLLRGSITTGGSCRWVAETLPVGATGVAEEIAAHLR